MKKMEKSQMDEKRMVQMAELFKMFGDSTRIKILYTLFAGERCVNEIGEEIQMGQSAISHQLRLLRQAKLVKCRRDGKLAYYSLDDDHVKTIIDMANEHLEESR